MVKLTEEQQNYIKENYKTKKYKDIATSLGLSGGHIHNWCIENDLCKYGKPEDFDNDLVISDYLSGLSKFKVAQKHNTDEGVITKILKKNNIPIRDLTYSHQKYKLNIETFKEIDTEPKAYWLGFLYGDGYVHEKRGEVKLVLSEVDKSHVEAFQQFVGTDKPLKFDIVDKTKSKPGWEGTRNSWRLTITNRHFTDHIINVGCRQAKSFTTEFPKWMDTKFINSFIRGVFDADGCISYHKRNYGYQGYWQIIGATKFVLDIQDVLIKELGLEKIKYYKEKRVTVGDLGYTHTCDLSDMQAIYHYLYTDATIWLVRKKNKFAEYLKLREADVLC